MVCFVWIRVSPPLVHNGLPQVPECRLVKITTHLQWAANTLLTTKHCDWKGLGIVGTDSDIGNLQEHM